MAGSGTTLSSAKLRDRAIARALERWFAAEARDLAWRKTNRSGRRDPYRALVSEFMLHQTQVSRVVPAFDRFIARFPDIESLARAPVEDVIKQWEGLGYYRRARLVHAAAREIADRFGGEVPATVEELRSIPGVGAYTAGSIASIVFGVRAPIVDGNVRRVVVRIDGRTVREDDAARDRWAWKRARALVDAADSPGALNEALMELGGVICTPKAPRCDACPVASVCRARARGIQHRIPTPKAAPARRVVIHEALVVRDRRGMVAIEERPKTGMWAGQWQFPTLEGEGNGVGKPAFAAWAGVPGVEPAGEFTRVTSHRTVVFRVWVATVAKRPERPSWVWKAASAVGEAALATPHRMILDRFVARGPGNAGSIRVQPRGRVAGTRGV